MQLEALSKQFIFIIGSPRSGTTWLQTMLSAHPQVASLGKVEQTIFSAYIPPILDRWEQEKKALAEEQWTQGLPYIWKEEDFSSFIQAFLEKTYLPILAQNKTATHILDKHPGYANYIDVIHRFLPKAKFIHLIRDGRDVAVSIMSAKQRVGFGDNEIYGATTRWKRNTTNACAADKYGDNQYLELRYDELVEKGNLYLKKIFSFCELDASDDVVTDVLEQNQQVSMPNQEVDHLRKQKGAIWKNKLSLRERYVFEQEAGNLLRTLGFEERTDWWALKTGDKLKIKLYMGLRTVRNLLRKIARKI